MYVTHVHISLSVSDLKLKVWNSVVLVIGVVAFISGVIIAVVLGTLLCLRIKRSNGEYACALYNYYNYMVQVSACMYTGPTKYSKSL